MNTRPGLEETRAAQRQFGRQAAHYVDSASHRNGDSLELLVALAQSTGRELVLDVATGVGFTAFALAPGSRWVMATDIAPQMLEQARRERSRRGLRNVSLGLAAAECLPFADGAFDRVACRTAAHHFADPVSAVREMARVLKPGGLLLLADTVAPEDELVSDWMNAVEKRRDPSHQRNLPPSEWRQVLADQGLAVTGEAAAFVPHELFDWVRRSGTRASDVAQLQRDLASASPAAREAFAIRREGETFRFQWPCSVFRAWKPS